MKDFWAITRILRSLDTEKIKMSEYWKIIENLEERG